MFRQFLRQLDRTENEHQNQRALHLAFLAITLFIFLVASPREVLGDPLFFGFLILLFILFYYTWRGRLLPVRLVLPAAGFLLTTRFVVIGGVYDEAVGGYYFLLAVAGLMLGQRALLFYGVTSALAVLVIGIAQVNGLIATHFAVDPTPLTVLTTALFLLATTFALNHLVVRLNRALHQARREEAELERRVEERTSELDFANQQLAEQLDRINSLQARLREEAIRDPLTGLFNRRYLDEMLPIELARSQRARLPLTVLMLDLDHFKRVNDTHGHPVGDLVLQAVADALKKNVRAGDIVCRYGGEEFLLVLPGMRNGDARNRAEVLRELIHQQTIPGTEGPFQLTASIGASVYPEHALTADELISLADQALYRAKQNGRNRVEFVL